MTYAITATPPVTTATSAASLLRHSGQRSPSRLQCHHHLEHKPQSRTRHWRTQILTPFRQGAVLATSQAPSSTKLSSPSSLALHPASASAPASAPASSDEEFDDDWEEYNPSRGPFVHHMVAGSMAGFVEHAGIYPIDWVKTHMQANRFLTTVQMRSILRRTSPQGFYRGLTAVFWGCVPAHAMYFSVYEQSKEQFGANEAGHHPFAAAASGATATVFHDVVMTPLDVCKQRMQLGLYGSVGNAIRSIVHTEGVSSLFLSLPTTILMNIPFAAVNVAVNESSRRYLNPNGQYDFQTFVVSGFLAGAVAGAVTNPLDVIKTRLQTQSIGCNVEGCDVVLEPGSRPLGVVGGTTVQPGQRMSRARSAKASSGAGNVSGSNVAGRASRLIMTAAETDICVRRYSGLFGTAKLIFREEGMYGFMRGTLARVLTQAPAAALSWSTYEFGKNFLSKYF